MAISLVGSIQTGTAANGGDVTLTFDGSPAEDDVVLLVGGIGDNDASGDDAGPTTAGYTERASYKDVAIAELNVGVWTKPLGATPDSTVTGDGGGGTRSGVAYASLVLRGVDTTTPIDATIVETGPSQADPPDVDGITTVTDGAWVIPLVCGGAFMTQGPTVAPSGYSNLTDAEGVDSDRVRVALATKLVSSAGSENPGAYTWDNSETGYWYGFTIAVRPADAGGTPATVTPPRSPRYGLTRVPRI